MSQGVDKDAVKAWAEALRTGLGLVRFSDLPQPAFDQLLNGAAHQGRELHLVVATHATMEGLDHLEAAYSGDAEMLELCGKRRAELLGEVPDNVVAFPGTVGLPLPIPLAAKPAPRLEKSRLSPELLALPLLQALALVTTVAALLTARDQIAAAPMAGFMILAFAIGSLGVAKSHRTLAALFTLFFAGYAESLLANQYEGLWLGFAELLPIPLWLLLAELNRSGGEKAPSKVISAVTWCGVAATSVGYVTSAFSVGPLIWVASFSLATVFLSHLTISRRAWSVPLVRINVGPLLPAAAILVVWLVANKYGLLTVEYGSLAITMVNGCLAVGPIGSAAYCLRTSTANNRSLQSAQRST